MNITIRYSYNLITLLQINYFVKHLSRNPVAVLRDLNKTALPRKNIFMEGVVRVFNNLQASEAIDL